MENQFIAYDYKEVVADRSKLSFLLDGYENFGWEQDKNMTDDSVTAYRGVVSPYSKKSVLRIKRDRKIINKMELTRLQRNFESCVKEIDVLEASKTSKATSWALVVGVLGTAFMAGSVFAITAPVPQVLLCIVLAIPAFIGWIFPYFIYQKIKMTQTKKMDELIEQKYDEIYEICEKGSKLIKG